MRSRRTSCSRHVATLIDRLGGAPEGPEVEAALAHVERCESCRIEVAELRPLAASLRRSGVVVRDAEPGSDGWSRVLARLGAADGLPTRRPTTAHLGALASAVAVPAMVVLLLFPAAGSQLGGGASSGADATVTPAIAELASAASSPGDASVVAGASVAAVAGGGRADAPRLWIDPRINGEASSSPSPQVRLDPHLNEDAPGPATIADASVTAVMEAGLRAQPVPR